jgi:hypothetical protein
VEYPGNKDYWKTSHGRYVMRFLAYAAARNDRRDIVAYICEECGVPVNAVRAEEGLWQVPGLEAVDVPDFDSQMTPLIGAGLAYAFRARA